MFGGGTSTEYDDIVNKTTDENLTSENWELILNLCDKVQDEGQAGAHNAIAAILKRLTHRNPNVQLYALSLTESLSKNLGIEIHRELASRAFTQALEKLITDRNTHEKVRRRALGLIALWTAEFENNESLGIMEDCYNNLKAKNYKFEQPEEPAPPTVDDEIRRKEEEELQRVLEMSMQDRGGRGQWSDYSLTSGSSSNAAGSSSAATGRSSTAATSSTAGPSSSSSTHPFAQPKYQAGGYVPARTPSPVTIAAQQRQQQLQYQQAQQIQAQQQLQQAQAQAAHSVPASVTESLPPTLAATPAPTTTSQDTPAASMSSSGNIVTRVRALHAFEATEPGELAFEQGDIIKVVDRGYKDWWRGQLKGRTGIFPVNYVEAMPEPTAAELAKEAEQEAAVFSQAVNVEKLLNMLRALDPAKDNLADNEEIQELYRASMALRPKIVKLIDKYSQKRADLVSMNETFVRARNIFDRMMEESLARHTAVYDQSYRPSPYGQGRPDSRGAAGRRPEYGPGPSPGPQQGYGWNGPAGYEQPGYNSFVAPQTAYNVGPDGTQYPAATPGPGQLGPQQQGYIQQQQQPQQQPQQPPQQQQQIIPQQGGYVDPAAAAAAYGGVPQQQQQQVASGYGVVPQGGYAGHQPNIPYTQQGPTPYPSQQQQPALQQQQPQPIQQQQPIQQPQPVQQQQPQPIQQPIQPQQQQQAVQQQPVQSQPIQQPIQAQPAQQPQIQVQNEVLPVQQQGQTALPSQAQGQQQQQQQQQQLQPQPQPQPQAQTEPQQPISGPPPYVYNPSYTYADPNVQAWAQYYNQGGKDLAGAVYFHSIPGVTDTQPAAAPQGQNPLENHGGEQAQQQQQQQQQQQRQQSYDQQAQAQPQPQQLHSQTDPTESILAYNTIPAARAASPLQAQQAQQLQNVTRYQLQDGPSPTQPQIQTQYDNQYQPPSSAVDIALGQQQQASPTNSIGTQRPISGGSFHSPTQIASTPSWVLPKKTTPGAIGGRGGSFSASSGAPGESYFPLTNQLGGLSLADQSGNASGQNHQGVGLPA